MTDSERIDTLEKAIAEAYLEAWRLHTKLVKQIVAEFQSGRKADENTDPWIQLDENARRY